MEALHYSVEPLDTKEHGDDWNVALRTACDETEDLSEGRKRRGVTENKDPPRPRQLALSMVDVLLFFPRHGRRNPWSKWGKGWNKWNKSASVCLKSARHDDVIETFFNTVDDAPTKRLYVRLSSGTNFKPTTMLQRRSCGTKIMELRILEALP